MTNTTRIFKLQRPLSGWEGPLLAYDQSREHIRTLEMTPRLRGLFADRVKIYVRASLTPEGLDVLEIVHDRGW